MHKNMLSKEELAGLLSPADQDAVDREPTSDTAEGRPEVRGDYRDLAVQYLQDTVQELQKEIASLRHRVEALEKRPGVAPKAAPAVKEKKNFAAEVLPTPPDPALSLSRVERHRSKKGKWF